MLQTSCWNCWTKLDKSEWISIPPQMYDKLSPSAMPARCACVQPRQSDSFLLVPWSTGDILWSKSKIAAHSLEAEKETNQSCTASQGLSFLFTARQ